MFFVAMESGKALQIVKLDKHKFELDLNLLEEVLHNPEIRDRKVALISIAGAYRKGKSFLLGFFLRYLYATVSIFFLFNLSNTFCRSL